MRLFVGDDWAEDHHDVEVMNEAGKVLARKRLPEGVAGMAQLHALAGAHLGEGEEDAEVIVGTETDRGPWAQALIAAGYRVFPVNPLQASRYRQRHGVSGAKSDAGDAHVLADMVRTDSHQLRPAAGDSPEAEGIKVLARTHKTLIWERTRAVQRLRHQLREYFPAALEAFEDLDAPDALELMGKAPDPARAARLTRAQVSAALKRARRRDIPGKATAILAALRAGHLGQPEEPGHPRLGQEKARRRPVHPQRPACRRAEGPGLRIAERLARRSYLLRQPPRTRDRAQRRAPPPGQPPRRHPARMPQDPHPLQRDHRLGPPGKPPSIFRSGLTFKLLGCLSADPDIAGADGWGHIASGVLAAYLSAHRTMINGSALCAALAVTERD